MFFTELICLFPSNAPSNTQNQDPLCNLFPLGLSTPWVKSPSNDSNPMVVVLPLLHSLRLLRSLSSSTLSLQCKAGSPLRSGYPCSCCCWFYSEDLPLVPLELQSREARAPGSSWRIWWSSNWLISLQSYRVPLCHAVT